MVLNGRFVQALGAALSAALCLLSVPPLSFWPAALVCWTPLIVVVARAPLRTAASVGLLHGLLVNLGAFYWVYPPLRTVAELPAWQACSLFFVLIVVQALRSVLTALLTAAGTRRRWPLLAVFPLALVTAELVCPVPFPWYTALFTNSVTAWMQLADIGGPLLLSAWLALVCAGFAQAWLLRKSGLRSALVALRPALAVLAFVTSYGVWKVARVDAWAARAETTRIGVVQGNQGPAGRERRDPADVYRELSLRLLAREPELNLLVWPETAIDYPTERAKLGELFRNVLLRDRRQGSFAPRIEVPLVTGMVVARSARGAPTELTNSAVLADASGRVLGNYDKQTLIPLGERPLFDFIPGVGKALPAVSTFVAGKAAGALELGRHRLGLSICYEDILHRQLLASTRELRPELLLNLTSDSWFAGSPGPKLHLAMAALRAVEQRKYLLRATSGGVSALIGPSGRKEWQLPEGQAASGAVSLHWLDQPTPYQRWGDLPWALAVVLAFAAAFVRRGDALSIEAASLPLARRRARG